MKFKALSVAVFMVMSLFSITPAQAVGETLDQSVTNVPADAGFDNTRTLSQTFTAGASGVLARMDLSVAKQNRTTVEPLTVKIQPTDGSGNPDYATVLATAEIPASRVGVNKSWVRVIFSTPATLVAGTKYAISLSTNQDEGEDNNSFKWASRDWNDVDYAAGAGFGFIYQNSTLLTSYYDFGFKTYSGPYTAPITTVTYNLDGGNSMTPIEENHDAGESFFIAANPTRPGYVFNGWTDQNNQLFGGFDYISDTYTMGSENVTFKANWLPTSHPITRMVPNNDAGGTDIHWFWNGGSLHSGTDVTPGWCVVDGPGSNPANWTVIGRSSDAQSESFQINAPNTFQAAAYTFSPDPNIAISRGATQVVKPNQPIVATTVTNTGCPANRFTISPALPTGLTLNEQTGEISGTPTDILSRTEFTLTAERHLNEDTLALDPNGFKAGEDSKTFTLTVSNAVTSSARPLLSQYFTHKQTSLSPFDLLRLKTVVSKLRNGSTVKLVAYVYGSGSAANRYSKSFASVLAKSIKTLKPSIRTTIDFKYCRTAPAAAAGSKWIDNSIRVDLAK